MFFLTHRLRLEHRGWKGALLLVIKKFEYTNVNIVHIPTFLEAISKVVDGYNWKKWTSLSLCNFLYTQAISSQHFFRKAIFILSQISSTTIHLGEGKTVFLHILLLLCQLFVKISCSTVNVGSQGTSRISEAAKKTIQQKYQPLSKYVCLKQSQVSTHAYMF